MGSFLLAVFGAGAGAASVVGLLAGVALGAGLVLPVVGAGAVALLAVAVPAVAAGAGNGGSRESTVGDSGAVALLAVEVVLDVGHVDIVGVHPGWSAHGPGVNGGGAGGDVVGLFGGCGRND